MISGLRKALLGMAIKRELALSVSHFIEDAVDILVVITRQDPKHCSNIVLDDNNQRNYEQSMQIDVTPTEFLYYVQYVQTREKEKKTLFVHH